MTQKRETVFRSGHVRPFLRTLKNTHAFAIQQVALVGTPDYLLVCRGRFVALELKIDSGKLSPLQKHNLDLVAKCGGIAMVAFPGNWAYCKEVLTKLDKGTYNDQDQVPRTL